MKTDKILDYARRVDCAVKLLSERLQQDEVPALDELAGAAAMSKYHFHRIFRLLTGETVNEMVRRVRLAKGSGMLTSSSVTEAAGQAAYATSQAFARSMRSVTGMSASEVMKSRDIAALFTAPAGGAPLAIEVVTLDPINVIAIRNVGDYADLNRVFGRLFEIGGGPETVEAIYGLYHSDPRFDPQEECVFDAAVRLIVTPDDTGEAQTTSLGGGQFLQLRHLGDYDLIPLALDELTLVAIGDDTIELRDDPALVHYFDDPEECSETELRSDVFLPIRSLCPRRC